MRDSTANVYLTGLSGSGKSTVAPLLAELLDYHAIDIDRLVESRSGSSIPDLFRDQGEAVFRDFERQAVVDTARAGGCVVALGGGALLEQQTRAIVTETGTLVHLAADVPTILARLGDGKDRPLLDGDVKRRLCELAEERRELYDSAAITVVTDELTPHEVAHAVATALGVPAGRM